MADFYHEAGKGSKIRSSEDKKKFDEGYEAIFGKKETWLDRKEREAENEKIKHDNCTD